MNRRTTSKKSSKSVGPTFSSWMRSSGLVHLTASVTVATILGSIPVFSDTEESEGRQMKQC
jgi:hypothetical protein